MKLNKSKILFITVLVTAALIGLILIQISLLKNSYEQKKLIFNQNVIAALNQTSKMLQESETTGEIFQFTTSEPFQDNVAQGSKGIRKIIIEDTSKDEKRPHLPKIYLTLNTIDDTSKVNFTYRYHRDSNKVSSNYSYNYGTDSNKVLGTFNYTDEIKKLRNLDSTKKKQMVTSVVDRLIISDRLPLEKRVSVSKIDSLLKLNLANSGITIPYSFGVSSSFRDSVNIVMSKGDQSEYSASPLKAMLFPSEITPVKNFITIGFPGSDMFLYRQIMPELILSIVFMAIIIFSFVVIIRTIFFQKRFSTHIIDFINNMTHEFKTPISTIALASEAISKPETLENEERLKKYNSIIHDENIRMKQQVERILQMAVIEQGDYDLNMQSIDVHEMILNAVKNISLKVESRGGAVKCILAAEDYVIKGDQLHFNNIINNILDNAEKYTNGLPVISVITENKGNNLFITVKDNGIGIKEEDIKKIFDKYYRVPTGNIHNVKGFGLGLSYVELLTKAQGGNISIESTPGKGTDVIISFPTIELSSQ